MIRSNDRAPVPPRLAQGKCVPNNDRMRVTVLPCNVVVRINQFNLLGQSDDQTDALPAAFC